MILGVDAHKLATAEKTGTDEVTYHFIHNLDQELIAEFDQVLLYTKKPIEKHLPADMAKNISVKTINMPWLWSTFGLSLEMKFFPPDVLFVPAHSLPHWFPAKTATIIHDIGFFDYPENYSPQQYIHLEKTTFTAIKKAAMVFTPTEFVKRSLINKYSADPNKIITSPLGVDTNFFHGNHSQTRINQVLGKYDERISKKPFIFFLGRVDYRKNISNILKSFKSFKKITKYPHILVIGGKPGVGYSEFEKEAEELNLGKDVVFSKYIAKKHLPIFYSEAEMLLFPSLYEGFGIPILEAQACRTAVITSNSSAMPEVAGDGALLVDPNNIQEIANAIKKIIDNPSLRQTLIEKGSRNCVKYPWQNFTRTILSNLVKLGKKI